MTKTRTTRHLLRYLGPQWILFRVWYSARQRLGLLERRLPVSSWEAQPLRHFFQDTSICSDPTRYLGYRRENSPVFLFKPGQRQQFASLFAAWDTKEANPVLDSEKVKEGKFPYFERTMASVGVPPDWHINPFSGQKIPAGGHWSKINDFGYGDIKVIWEPSRFAFVYSLVRAYWRTGDEEWAELFWQLVESWRAQNPPQQGPNWKCGQEISFRVMAWCFGLYGFLDSQATTGERVASLAQMMAVSGERIAANLSYALGQRNNHGISEGMGLWTIGTLFPELRLAEKWQKQGREVLETLGRELIYDDGSFVQHSVNYHRLMLDDYLWSLRLGELHGAPFSRELKERLGRAGEFLFQIQDTESGQTPYYGQNDGAHVLPLSNCDYLDFRPVIQATHYLVTGARCYPEGPWDEELWWLFGPESLTAPCRTPEKKDLRADKGGYYTLRSSSGFIFTRCATFRHRPGQADMLHLDLWWQGQNIALDAGTYSYNAPAPWDNPLACTACHNTVMVDGLDQMDRAGKFLWLPWLQSRVRSYQQSPKGHLAYWEGEHNGYERLEPSVYHRRGIVRLAADHWLVVDALSSQDMHCYRLHWLFPDLPYIWETKTGRLNLQTCGGSYQVRMAMLSGLGSYSLLRADQQSPRGWRAPYYHYREPALSVDLTAKRKNIFFWTLFGPDDCTVSVDEQNKLQINGSSWRALLKLPHKIDKPLINFISFKGIDEDKMEIFL